MKKIFGLTALVGIMIGGNHFGISVAASEQPLLLVYPPNNHQTTAEQIFLIGTAAREGQVLVNGEAIERSQGGHFAPSFPLKIGDNLFTIRYQNQEIKLKVTRTDSQPKIPTGVAFVPDSLIPQENISRLPEELICFGVIASPNGKVSVQIGQQIISLFPQLITTQLPANSALLTGRNQPSINPISNYQGCAKFSQIGQLGNPLFKLSLNNQIITEKGTGAINILNPNQLKVIEVTADSAITRTGPSSDYSRLTPLPKGTQANVTGKEGDWLRLDYGAWINQNETKLLSNHVPIKSIIRSIKSRQVEGATEIIFPLQFPVPVAVQQGEKTITLTLYNTVAQTDTILLDDDRIIKRLDWQQITPNQINYTFNLKAEQQWGYTLRYEGTSLILSLRHPPKFQQQNPLSLEGIKILLDPGHGGKETGSQGPNGYLEKDANLVISQLLKKELINRGATVYMTRETDEDVSLPERVEQINKLKPTVSISLHYNALPDGGDAMNTEGISAFWYHPQAHNLAIFLHNYLITNLNRPDYGVFWNNLALTRPQSTPSILLELGFMINPHEFEWITNPQEQEKLAKVLGNGITEWFSQQRAERQ